MFTGKLIGKNIITSLHLKSLSGHTCIDLHLFVWTLKPYFLRKFEKQTKHCFFVCKCCIKFNHYKGIFVVTVEKSLEAITNFQINQ